MLTNNMKPSGIDWIGDIPSDWEVGRIKYCYDIVLGKMLQPSQEKSTDREMYYMCSANVTWNGIDLSVLKQMWFSPIEVGIYLLQKGDLLVAEGGDVAIACIWNNELQECCLQNALHLVRNNKKYLNKFLFYWLYFLKHTGYIDLVCNKATIAHFTKEKFGETPICILSIKEQYAVVSFLDTQCSKIDSIVAELEQQIEILKQYKTSLITETVTKGLNKNVPMKNSGIDWIGKIPAHWEVSKIKYSVSLIGSGTTPASDNSEYYNGEYNWIQSGDLFNVNEITMTEKKISKLATKTFQALNYYTSDFIVLAMYGASVGNVAISKIDAYSNQACCCIKPDKNTDLRYMYYFFVISKVDLIEKAVGGGQPNISQIVIKNEHFLKVPLVEQQAIANFLDTKCKEITNIITEKQQSIDTMKAYKKSLIYEYVTGKKRVNVK